MDKIASEIMATEAMKLITEAYEEVFEGKTHARECEGSGMKINEEVCIQEGMQGSNQ